MGRVARVHRHDRRARHVDAAAPRLPHVYGAQRHLQGLRVLRLQARRRARRAQAHAHQVRLRAQRIEVGGGTLGRERRVEPRAGGDPPLLCDGRGGAPQRSGVLRGGRRLRLKLKKKI